MTHRQIIAALGGYKSVAADLGRHPSRAFRWQKTGIPPEMWLSIIELAARKSVFLSLEGVARAAPRNRIAT